ncbi:MAG TPA: hypothetical protein P5248_09910 [Bacteroidales bacterium]|nr:hypothetical protein [Bacteroidales bacterium]
MDRIFNDIDFEFTGTRYYVIGRTVFRNSMNSLWTGINDATSALFSGGNRAMINYTVYFPEKATVRVENKFGNIYTTDHVGKVEFILSNGDLKAHALKGEVSIDLTFGNADVRSVERGRMDLGYGEFEFGEIGDADLYGKSARINVERAGRLRIDSRRDKLKIGRVGGLTGSTSFSDVSIEQLTDEAGLNTKYGDLSIGALGVALRYIDLEAEYTDIRIGSNIPMDLDLTYDEKTQQVFSDGVKKVAQVKVGEDMKLLRRAGPTQEGSGRAARVRVRLTGGSLSL